MHIATYSIMNSEMSYVATVTAGLFTVHVSLADLFEKQGNTFGLMM